MVIQLYTKIDAKMGSSHKIASKTTRLLILEQLSWYEAWYFLQFGHNTLNFCYVNHISHEDGSYKTGL